MVPGGLAGGTHEVVGGDSQSADLAPPAWEPPGSCLGPGLGAESLGDLTARGPGDGELASNGSHWHKVSPASASEVLVRIWGKSCTSQLDTSEPVRGLLCPNGGQGHPVVSLLPGSRCQRQTDGRTQVPLHPAQQPQHRLLLFPCVL